MSALSPLYLLGLLAIAGPIVFHMIQRRPRGERPFSSLMFFTPSPPRLTRRGRPENWPLLILRALALALLACAFARPFLRARSALGLDEPAPRHTALLVDVSASMRRGSLWKQAMDRARATIAEQRPADELAIFAFGASTRPALGFREARALELSRRGAVAMERLEALAPTWGPTHLGQALMDAVNALQDDVGTGGKGPSPSGTRRVVLISDLQQGGRLDALREREWPADIELDVRPLHDETPNAGLHAVARANTDDDGNDDNNNNDGAGNAGDGGKGNAPDESAAAGTFRGRRVRIENGPRSARETFTLRWIGPDDRPIGGPVTAYVPPGESRTLRVRGPEGKVAPRALVLEGDAAPFDNTLYVAERPDEEWTIVFIGDDRADDPQGELYYLERAFSNASSNHLRVRVLAQPRDRAFGTEPEAVAEGAGKGKGKAEAQAKAETEPGPVVPLVVVSGEPTLENARRLKEHVERGGALVYLARQTDAARALAEWTGGPPAPIDDADVNGDTLLGEIAFDHPLFAAFAAPQYNDFTKIHFWARRDLSRFLNGRGGRVLARFERGAPAVWETSLGKGTLTVFASGWRPSDSQFARSTKFVPLMSALLNSRAPRRLAVDDHAIGDPVALPAPREAARPWTVRKPSGATVALPPGGQSFTQTDEPGFYAIDDGTDTGTNQRQERRRGPRGFVVNLAASESNTIPMSVDVLERLGCRLADPARERVEMQQRRQLRGAELENRQKLWRWLIVAVILVLIVETAWAGRAARRRVRPVRAEGLST